MAAAQKPELIKDACACVCDFIAPPIELSLWAKNMAMVDMTHAAISAHSYSYSYFLFLFSYYLYIYFFNSFILRLFSS